LLSKKIEQLLRKLSTDGVLTVGDAASFTRQGGMIGLLTVGDHIAIQMNVDARHKAKLNVS
jgi:hypothetical protein